MCVLTVVIPVFPACGLRADAGNRSRVAWYLPDPIGRACTTPVEGPVRRQSPAGHILLIRAGQQNKGYVMEHASEFVSQEIL